jgi:hypothetical protein
MGGARNTSGEREEVHTGFLWGSLRVGEHLESLGLDGRIILKRNLKMWNGGLDWIDLTQGENM